jgi:hypothetical protein
MSDALITNDRGNYFKQDKTPQEYVDALPLDPVVK